MAKAKIAALALVWAVLNGAALADERPAFVPPPAADEARLTGPELAALLTDGVIECGSHRLEDDTCEEVNIYSVSKGRLRIVGMAVISDAPRIELAGLASLFIQGDAVCLNLSDFEFRFLHTIDVPKDRADAMSKELAEQVHEEMKPNCAVYARQGDRLRARAFEEIRPGVGKEIDPFVTDFSLFLPKGSPLPTLRTMRPDDEQES